MCWPCFTSHDGSTFHASSSPWDTAHVEALRGLFEPELPPGFSYHPGFITAAEEQVLAEALVGVAFSEFEMRGAVARRRVAFFGRPYVRGAVSSRSRRSSYRCGPGSRGGLVSSRSPSLWP